MFYYLVQDLKALVFSLISLHFKVGDTSYSKGSLTKLAAFIDQANLRQIATTLCLAQTYCTMNCGHAQTSCTDKLVHASNSLYIELDVQPYFRRVCLESVRRNIERY